jgi:hypothetical protein
MSRHTRRPLEGFAWKALTPDWSFIDEQMSRLPLPRIDGPSIVPDLLCRLQATFLPSADPQRSPVLPRANKRINHIVNPGTLPVFCSGQNMEGSAGAPSRRQRLAMPHSNLLDELLKLATNLPVLSGGPGCRISCRCFSGRRRKWRIAALGRSDVRGPDYSGSKSVSRSFVEASNPHEFLSAWWRAEES